MKAGENRKLLASIMVIIIPIKTALSSSSINFFKRYE